MDRTDLRGVLSQITELAPDASDFTERYNLIDFRLDGFYSNPGNALLIMDWYTCIPRISNTLDPAQEFTQSGTAESRGDSLEPVAATAIQTGITPFDYSSFCTKYLIVNKRRVML